MFGPEGIVKAPQFLCALRAFSERPAVTAPTEDRSEACVVSLLDWLRAKASSAEATKLERLVSLLNEIVAEGVLPAL